MGEIFRRVLPSNALEWTGERLTTATTGQVEVEHLHRYFLARELCRGLDVLDVAAGEGYGAALLAQTARSVTGVEVSADAITHAARTYRDNHARFVRGDARRLPLSNGSIDAVVSFETIEHFFEHDEFVTEVKRVLRPGGRLILSSPERDVYSPSGSSANPYHVRELSRTELDSLLHRFFGHVHIMAQRPAFGSVLVGEETGAVPWMTFEKRGPDYFEATPGLPRAVYLLAVASDQPVSDVPSSLYIETSAIEPMQDAERVAKALHGELLALRTHLAAAEVAVRHAREEVVLGHAREDQTVRQLRETLHVQEDRMREREEMMRAQTLLLSHVQGATDQLERQIRLAQARLTAMYGSTSWRVTAPLRLLSVTLRSAARHLTSRQTGSSASAPERSSPLESAAVVATSDSVASDAKAAMRADLLARLQAFLAGSETLRMPTSDRPTVSIILILHNQAELTFGCLKSIAECLTRSHVLIEVILFDNNSTDQTTDLLARTYGVKVVRSAENLHFLHGVNRAASEAVGTHLLLLNNDAQLLPGALEAAVRTIESDASIGAVGGRIILPDGILQEAGSIIWKEGTCSGYGRGDDPAAPQFMYRRDVDYCSAAFLLTRRHLFERSGRFDERFAPAYYEEVDYCVRLWRLGLRVVFDPDIAIVHYEFGSASPGPASELQQRNQRIFCERHRHWLNSKPSCSPQNLLAARTVPADQKRILVIEDRVPHAELGTGYPRTKLMVQEMVDAGAHVSFYPTLGPVEAWVDVRRALDPKVEVMLGGSMDGLKQFLKERMGYYDGIVVCRPHNMQTFAEAIAPDRHPADGALVAYDAEAVFARRTWLRSQVDGTGMTAEDARRLIADEVRLVEPADVVISVSETESRMFHDCGIGSTIVLGHAIDIEPTSSSFDDRDGFIFLGALQSDDSPNADSLRWFAEYVLPLIRRELGAEILPVVVGLNSAPSVEALNGKAFNLMGMSEDLAPWFEKPRVMIAPTRYTAGIPLKVYQAAALGVPVVATTIVAEQAGWEPGRELLAASDPSGFAEACVRLHRDKALWESVRAAAIERCRRDCSPHQFRQGVRQVLRAVTSGHDRVRY